MAIWVGAVFVSVASPVSKLQFASDLVSVSIEFFVVYKLRPDPAQRTLVYTHVD